MTPDESIDIVALSHAELADGQEFALGMRELRRRLPAGCRWYVLASDAPAAATAFPSWSDAARVLVILNPAILVADNLVAELMAALDAGAACALPSDPRGFAPGIALDYATRPGFDRFVSRLADVARWRPMDARTPWLYLVRRDALVALGTRGEAPTWAEVPARLGEATAIAQRTFVHSYADYHLNDRAEMLPLVPPEVRSLLDVGGGQGNFARAFQQARGGSAVLLEQNPASAAAARQAGLTVIEGDFGTARLPARFDCVAMLDVLEHLPDPLAALRQAHGALRPGGYLLLSVPNAGHWPVVRDLLEGQFDYQPVGVLCNTHLRFFTQRSLEKLLGEAGFGVVRRENPLVPPPPELAAFFAGGSRAGIAIDSTSLATESLHVLARRN